LQSGEKTKIFYIFMKNLKKLNNKYVSRKNVEALIQLKPNDPHERILSKSVKRLELLPI
jgi:cell division protein FtsX